MAALRARYPKASPGVLFSVFKLQQDATLTIRDFRDEAALHGIKIAGRALHSARVLLGLEKPATRRATQPKRDATPPADPPDLDDVDIERSLISVVQKIQESGTAEANRLRAAMRAAIEVLQRALDGRD